MAKDGRWDGYSKEVNGYTIEPDVDLSGVDFTGADFSGGFGARLQRANLQGAKLERANLNGANITGANLYGANFWGANLQGADLQRADLSQTINLANASYSNTKIDPDNYLIMEKGFAKRGLTLDRDNQTLFDIINDEEE